MMLFVVAVVTHFGVNTGVKVAAEYRSLPDIAAFAYEDFDRVAAPNTVLTTYQIENLLRLDGFLKAAADKLDEAAALFVWVSDSDEHYYPGHFESWIPGTKDDIARLQSTIDTHRHALVIPDVEVRRLRAVLYSACEAGKEVDWQSFTSGRPYVRHTCVVNKAGLFAFRETLEGKYPLWLLVFRYFNLL
jgi:hypothetical protein